MTAPPPSTASKAANTLETYESHAFHSLSLRNSLVSKWSGNQNHNNTENLTCATNLSDINYEVDPNDMDRIEQEMAEFKNYLSAVKFNWMEMNVKRRYISRILGNDVAKLVSQSDNDELDAVRAEKKARLQALKATTTDLSAQLKTLSDQLDTSFPPVTALATTATPLLTSISALELELATLRASRSQDPSQDLTVAEAEAVLQGQEEEMAELVKKVGDGKTEMVAVKTGLAKERRECEKLGAERAGVEKAEAEARRSIGGGGGQGREIEEGCRWYATTTEAYRSLLGILSVNVIGADPSHPNELQITYDLGHPRTATLAISFHTSPVQRLAGARLIDSSEDISDIVEGTMASGDVALLVQEVLSRIMR